jgi:hypothetical protein
MLIISLLKRIWKIFVLEKECNRKIFVVNKNVRGLSRDCTKTKESFDGCKAGKLKRLKLEDRRERVHCRGHSERAEKEIEMSDRRSPPYGKRRHRVGHPQDSFDR